MKKKMYGVKVEKFMEEHISTNTRIKNFPDFARKAYIRDHMAKDEYTQELDMVSNKLTEINSKYKSVKMEKEIMEERQKKLILKITEEKKKEQGE